MIALNINPGPDVGAGMAAKITLPPPPTAPELAKGLDDERTGALQAVADRLRQNADRKSAAAAIAATAKQHHATVGSFRRRFAELARCAGWVSATPEDYLAGRETRRGGYRHGVPSAPGGKRSMGGAVNEATRKMYDEAQRKMGNIGFEQFIRAASGHILSGRRFLGLDSQSAED